MGLHRSPPSAREAGSWTRSRPPARWVTQREGQVLSFTPVPWPVSYPEEWGGGREGELPLEGQELRTAVCPHLSMEYPLPPPHFPATPVSCL